MFAYAKYPELTEWNVNVCVGCGLIDIDTMEFIYSDYEAAEVMLGYVNELRESVYGTDEYNLQVDTTLVELAKIRAKELTTDYDANTGTFTNAAAIIADGGYGVKSHFDMWSSSSKMTNKAYVYFGYALYRIPETGLSAGCYGIALFWTEQTRNGYFS